MVYNLNVSYEFSTTFIINIYRKTPADQSIALIVQGYQHGRIHAFNNRPS